MWLINRAKMTKGAAREQVRWARRAAAQAGAGRPALAVLAAEIYTRSLPDPPGDGGGNLGLDFEDRRVRVETTFGGAGIIAGDLTAECAAVVTG